MRPLILVGASGLAREALAAARAQNLYEVVGVVDDDSVTWGEPFGDVKVLGGLEVLASYPDVAVLLCVGKGLGRNAIATRLRDSGFTDSRYASVIHPTVSVPDGCSVGYGTILLAGCVLTAAVTIGRHAVLMPNVTITHDGVIEDFATLCAGAVLGGSVRIRNAAYVGMSCSIREGVDVGSGSVIGMGAVVLGDVPDGETWFGVPAMRRSEAWPLDREGNGPK